MINRTIALAIAAVALSAAGPALAATAIYTLSAVDPDAQLGAGPFGTVSVEESAGSLIFTETLNSGFKIHDGNGNHNAFAFILTGDPAVSITNLTAGFAVVASATSTAPPFTGQFTNAIDCTSACGPGYDGGFSGPLTFKVSAISGTLSLGSLGFLSTSYGKVYFAGDVVNARDKTGNVGALASASAVPEIASWVMMVGGFGATGGMIRRKRSLVARAI